MSTWAERSIKQVAHVRLGKMIQPAAKGVTDVSAPYLRAAHIQPQGRLIEVDDKEMWFDPLELRTLDLRRDDVVVVEGGAGFGRSAHLEHDLPGWGFQNSIVRVRPRTGLSCGRYLNYVFQSLLRTGRTGLEASVATIPHYTAEKVAATRHPMPSLSQQREIADFLDRETAQIDAMLDALLGSDYRNRTAISEVGSLVGLLQERREALITAAVTGRIDPATGIERIEEAS